VILFLHHRYRTTGGEERAVADMMWLVRQHLGEETALLERDSAATSATTAAAGLLAGGLRPEGVAEAVRKSGARIVHAHNLHPTLGWRALAAARAAGARVVMHLHQYRLVCAIGVCFRDGAECTRCHGRNTLPGVALNCRGSAAEAVAYGAALSLYQRRLTAQVDAFVVPSRFAGFRLAELGAPLRRPFVVPHVTTHVAAAPPPAAGVDPYGLVVSRLAPEKGVDVAIDACARLGLPLVVAGDGPERTTLERRAAQAGGTTRFAGRVDDGELARLRAGAAIAIVPSRSAETFGLAAAEAMAAGLPVAASRIGALPELVYDEWLAPAGDAAALAATITRLRAEAAAPARALARARERTAPEAVATALAEVYAAVDG
jgi:glycosyltransferase involved in cell wall biosynthesis